MGNIDGLLRARQSHSTGRSLDILYTPSMHSFQKNGKAAHGPERQNETQKKKIILFAFPKMTFLNERKQKASQPIDNLHLDAENTSHK